MKFSRVLLFSVATPLLLSLTCGGVVAEEKNWLKNAKSWPSDVPEGAAFRFVNMDEYEKLKNGHTIFAKGWSSPEAIGELDTILNNPAKLREIMKRQALNSFGPFKPATVGDISYGQKLRFGLFRYVSDVKIVVLNPTRAILNTESPIAQAEILYPGFISSGDILGYIDPLTGVYTPTSINQTIPKAVIDRLKGYVSLQDELKFAKSDPLLYQIFAENTKKKIKNYGYEIGSQKSPIPITLEATPFDAYYAEMVDKLYEDIKDVFKKHFPERTDIDEIFEAAGGKEQFPWRINKDDRLKSIFIDLHKKDPVAYQKLQYSPPGEVSITQYMTYLKKHMLATDSSVVTYRVTGGALVSDDGLINFSEQGSNISDESKWKEVELKLKEYNEQIETGIIRPGQRPLSLPKEVSIKMSTAPEIIATEKFTAEELAKMGKFTKGARFVGKWGGRIIVIVPVVIAGGEAYYQVKDMETGEAIANWAPYTIVNFAQMSDPGQIIRDLSERNKKQTEIRRQKNTAEDRAREIYLQSIQQERINRECAGLTGHDRTACEENIKKGIRAAQTNILQQREQKRIYDASGGAMEEGMREAWGGGLLRRVFGR